MKQWIRKQLEVFAPALIVLTIVGAVVGVFLGMVCAANYLDSIDPQQQAQRYSYSYSYDLDGAHYSYSYNYKRPEVQK